jgi:DnaJ-class molecular chaperone
MAADTVKHGRSVDSIVEGGCDGEFHRAILLSDLAGNLEAVVGEFAYDTDEPASDLLRMAHDLQAHVERLSITADATLTLNRTCDACGGDGKDWRLQEPERSMNPCEDCGGTGAASRDSQQTEETT